MMKLSMTFSSPNVPSFIWSRSKTMKISGKVMFVLPWSSNPNGTTCNLSDHEKQDVWRRWMNDFLSSKNIAASVLLSYSMKMVNIGSIVINEPIHWGQLTCGIFTTKLAAKFMEKAIENNYQYIQVYFFHLTFFGCFAESSVRNYINNVLWAFFITKYNRNNAHKSRDVMDIWQVLQRQLKPCFSPEWENEWRISSTFDCPPPHELVWNFIEENHTININQGEIHHQHHPGSGNWSMIFSLSSIWSRYVWISS